MSFLLLFGGGGVAVDADEPVVAMTVVGRGAAIALSVASALPSIHLTAAGPASAVRFTTGLPDAVRFGTTAPSAPVRLTPNED